MRYTSEEVTSNKQRATRLVWPLATIDESGRAGEKDAAGTGPAQRQHAARLAHLDDLVDETAQASGDDDGAGARAAGLRLADAALPGARLDVAAVEHAGDLEVEARRKEGVVLDAWPDLAQGEAGDGRVDEVDGVRVAH